MFSIVKSVANKFGVDRAIAYTILARLVQAGGGVATLYFVTRYLTKDEQGYIYTFGSLLAAQVFFELGLNSIIVQFVAHEVAHLRWTEDGVLEGDQYHLSRLSSLLHFFSKWFAILSALVLVILIIVGAVFFLKYNHNNTAISWQLPWVILVIGTASSLFISPYIAFLEGLGKVKEMAKARMAQQTTSSIAYIIFLMCHSGLFVTGFTDLATVACLLCFILTPRLIRMFRSLWKQHAEWKINYFKEIFPFQWKIALSWISGYFTFQLFTPVLFATRGAVEAGQMGMTLAALGGIGTLAMGWINTKIPLYSSLIAKKDYKQLDRVFFKTTTQSMIIIAIALITLLAIIAFLQYGDFQIGKRFLPWQPITLLCITTFINQFVFSAAAYLRCHKQEPLLLYSIVVSTVYATTLVIFTKLYGFWGLCASNCLVTMFVSLPWVYYVFHKKRIEWHSESLEIPVLLT